MPEQETPYFFKGHNFDLREFRRDLYRLLCHFEASEKISYYVTERCGLRFHATEQEDLLENLQREFFTDEVSRILLQTAICVRILDDEQEADSDEKAPRHCGTLEQPIGKHSRHLLLREACNKLIHATKINFDIEPPGSNAALLLSGICWVQPRVFLYGTRGKVEWKATIDVLDFVRQSASMLKYRTLAEFIQHERQHMSPDL